MIIGVEMEQLRLFAETREEKLYREVKQLRDSLDRVRKGQYAKIGALQKKYDILYEDMEILKRGLCQEKRPAELYEYLG